MSDKGQPTITSVLHRWRTIVNEAMSGREYEKDFLAAGKIEVDTELSEVKSSLSKAKAQAYMKGNFIPENAYRGMEDKSRELARISQTLQIFIKRAGDREKDTRRLHSNSVDRMRAMDFGRMFVQVCLERLPKEQFRDMANEAEARMKLYASLNDSDTPPPSSPREPMSESTPAQAKAPAPAPLSTKPVAKKIKDFRVGIDALNLKSFAKRRLRSAHESHLREGNHPEAFEQYGRMMSFHEWATYHHETGCSHLHRLHLFGETTVSHIRFAITEYLQSTEKDSE